jgi:hypothetical protein
LFLKLKKCAFAQSQIEYLGHIISSNGVAIDPSKTAAMVNWHIPTSLTEVRGFLGLTGYYRKFVKNYGVLAKPLTQLLKHKIFSWPLEADTTFQTLKHAMCCVPVLALLDFEVPFEIETDACEMGVGAMLSQNSHPIAFFSKALSIRNQQLPTYEKEFFVVLMSVDKWRPNLLNNLLSSGLTISPCATFRTRNCLLICNEKQCPSWLVYSLSNNTREALKTLLQMPYQMWDNIF